MLDSTSRAYRRFYRLIVVATAALFTQPATPQNTSATTLLNQLAASFSGGNTVQQVNLSGNAIWYAGSLEDTGSITLQGSVDGSSRVQISLTTLGSKTETKTGAGSNSFCQWSGSDEVLHDVDSENCWKPLTWFLPALSLQPTPLLSSIATVDLGLGAVGMDSSQYRHLQASSILTDLPESQPQSYSQGTASDLGLDPTTFEPSVLVFSVAPDSGSQTPITIEVHYSDYRSVNGVQLPFHIQRFINGSLQLDVTISSAQIN